MFHSKSDPQIKCLFDPMIQTIESAKCSLMKIFTGYYAKTELALPEWYFVQLFGDNPDSPGSFALQSILYLAQNRPSLIDVIRLKSSLATLIKKFYTTHGYELVIADLLAVLIENDEFEFWFPGKIFQLIQLQHWAEVKIWIR